MQVSAGQLQAVKQEVYTDESIEWVGQPRPLRFVRRGVWGSIYGMFTLALTIAWLAAATRRQPPDPGTGLGWLIVLVAAPIVLTGILLLLSPLWMWLAALRTTYVVTDERAIILRTGRLGRTRSFAADRVRYMIVRPQPDGSGDILFQPQSGYGRDGLAHVMATGFLGIEDVANVRGFLEALPDYREHNPSPVSRGERIGVWVAAIAMLILTAGFAMALLHEGVEMDLAVRRTPSGRIDAIARYDWTGRADLRIQVIQGILAAQVVQVDAGDSGTKDLLQLETPAGPVRLEPYDDATLMANEINRFIGMPKAAPLRFHQRASCGLGNVVFLAFTVVGAGLAILFMQLAWNSRWSTT